MKLVAVTGGIGCGKTTVLNEFRGLGIPCFLADEVAGSYYFDNEFLSQIRELFGGKVFLSNGQVDKRAIAEIVFHDKDKLESLNALIHPRVWADFLDFAQANSTAPYVIFESAIVYEYGFDKLVDKVVCVYLDKAERISRVQKRDHVTREHVESRMNNQMSAESKMMLADFVVLNYEGNPRSRQVALIHDYLC